VRVVKRLAVGLLTAIGIASLAGRMVAAAGVEWAHCARQNGFPDVRDPATPTLATVDELWPTATLPASTAEQDLRTSLEVCPVFDKDAHAVQDAEIDRLWALGIEPDASDFEEIIAPSVGFDVPGYDGTLPTEDSEFNSDEYAHLNCLLEIIYSEERDYQGDREDQLKRIMGS
jgi:hypothetical protein